MLVKPLLGQVKPITFAVCCTCLNLVLVFKCSLQPQLVPGLQQNHQDVTAPGKRLGIFQTMKDCFRVGGALLCCCLIIHLHHHWLRFNQ